MLATSKGKGKSAHHGHEIINIDELDNLPTRSDYAPSTRKVGSLPDDPQFVAFVKNSEVNFKGMSRATTSGAGRADCPIDVDLDVDDDDDVVIVPKQEVRGGDDSPSRKRSAQQIGREGPAFKKPKVATSSKPILSPPSRVGASSSTSSRKRKAAQLKEQDSVEVVDKFQSTKKSAGIKRVRMAKTDSDSEDEYDNAHSGLELMSGNNWTPLPSIHEAETIQAMEDLTIAAPQDKDLPIWRLLRDPAPPIEAPSRGMDDPKYLWNQLTVSKWHHQPKMKRSHIQVPMATRRCYGTSEYHMYHGLEAVFSFRQAPGVINKITQSGGLTAIATAATGGHPDPQEPEIADPYNKPGSLMLIHGQAVHISDGHKRRKRLSKRSSYYIKYYTVNDVKFDPRSSTHQLVSSGNDKNVRLWSYDVDNDSSSATMNLLHSRSFRDVPHDLSYKPGHSTLAVACQDGKIYIYPNSDSLKNESNSIHVSLSVAPETSEHSAGAMVWGAGATSDFIFASSEPYGDEHTGFHQAFDVNQGKVVYKLDASEAGDAMAMNSTGDRLALFTNGGTSSRFLRIFDVRSRYAIAAQMTLLESFTPITDSTGDVIGHGEVNCASFSGDDIYLAVGRSDNCVHVYDSRMLNRGPVLPFRHRGEHRNAPGHVPFGIVEAQWVDLSGRKLGLITGGTDGCVRLWDIRKAAESPENGKAIAEMDFDIGHFSLGDDLRGKQVLVVGDGGGGVCFFDRKTW